MSQYALSPNKKYFVLGLAIASFLSISLVLLPVMILEANKIDYLLVMRNLNSTQTRDRLRTLFDRTFNYTELLTWEHERLIFVEKRIVHKDPFQILEYGKGRCGEFSILYVALCLAHGYQARLVVDMYGDHMWAEIKLENKWVHVDPSDNIVNDPHRYERDWHKDLRLVLAFEDGMIEDVTTNYRMRR